MSSKTRLSQRALKRHADDDDDDDGDGGLYNSTIARSSCIDFVNEQLLP